MIDFKRFCQAHQIAIIEDGHHHTHSGWAQVHCPFCRGGQSGWHLGFNLTSGKFNCWRCGTKTVWNVIAELLHTSNSSKVYAALEEHKTRTVREHRQSVTRKKTIDAPPGCGPMQTVHKRYLRRRGFNPRHLEQTWAIQGTGHLGSGWSWRIVIPIFNIAGRIVAYQGRALGPDTRPKYKLSESRDMLENPAGLLYGLHRAPSEAVVVVEGVTGVWRLGPGAVGTLGIDWTSRQANKLREFKRRYILFDPEPTAQRQAVELAHWLSMFDGTTEVLDGFKTDPGDFSNRRAKRIMQELGLGS